MIRKVITVYTEKQFTCLNEYAADFVKNEKGLGLLYIFTKHTTCAIKIIESELLLLADINNFLNELIPQHNNYMHDKIEIRQVPPNERVNAFSHLRQLMFSTSETIPVVDGKLDLGKWQSIFLVELDPARDREIVLTYTN